MSHGAFHSQRTPEGAIVRLDDEIDGRCLKQLDRDTPYYVRLNLEFFRRLEALLDVPRNRASETAIPGCRARADLIEMALGAFLRLDALAREMNHRNVDELVTQLDEAIRFLRREGPTPSWLSIEQPVLTIPAPRSEPSAP